MTNPGLWCPPAAFYARRRGPSPIVLWNHRWTAIQVRSRMEEDMTNPGLSCPLPSTTRHTNWSCQ